MRNYSCLLELNENGILFLRFSSWKMFKGAAEFIGVLLLQKIRLSLFFVSIYQYSGYSCVYG